MSSIEPAVSELVAIVPVKERFFDFIFLTPSGRQPQVDLKLPLVENDLPVNEKSKREM